MMNKVLRAGAFKVAALSWALAGASLLAACAGNPVAARRAEGLEAARLTQGAPVAVALHKTESPDHDVAESELVWIDGLRQRAIPAHIFMPAANPRQALGVIIFSHGLGGSRLSYSQLGRYWAAHGFLSIHIQHPGSDRAIWKDAGLQALTNLRAAATMDNAIARARDVSFAIDQIGKEPVLSAVADLSRIAVAGHSFGANTALLIAGARFEYQGKPQSYGDPRVRAAIILSPPALPGDMDPYRVYEPIRIPTLHLTSTQDDLPIPGLVTMADRRDQPFNAIIATPRYLGVFTGGRHSMFHDRSRDPVSLAIKRQAMDLTTQFLRASLFDDEQARTSLGRRDLKLALPIFTRWDVRTGS